MLYAIQLKVLQNPEVKNYLLSTGDKVLIENAPEDWYWGCGQDGLGRNQLGQTLMMVRDQLK